MTTAASGPAAGPGTALAVLLDGLIDYAGLFPPAALAMPIAVAAYARYAIGPDRATLGRFVVPVARLAEFTAAVDALPHGAPTPRAPWRLSVLASASEAPAVHEWSATYGACLRIETVEAKAGSIDEIAALADAFAAEVTVYVELPVHEDPASLVAALAAYGLRAKIRTGGVTPEAFPTPMEVVRFLAACGRAGVPFKATAGLHHPLRGDYPLTYDAEAPRGTMYGYLNIFLAAALLWVGVTEEEVAPLLEERDAQAIIVDPTRIVWRTYALDAPTLARVRATFAGSFGSCSFEEPVQELTSLMTAGSR
ncbi:MAG: hypothetical protein ACO31W_00300 [Gemmatimonadaceae bacterium]|jgi:hypothetical protein